MATDIIVSCPICGYPLKAPDEGDIKQCAYCGEHIQALSTKISAGTTFLPVVLGLIVLLAIAKARG